MKAQEKNPFLFLHKAAVSKRHYRFLKALAKAQLVTVPMTILQTVMEDVFPAFEDIYNCIQLLIFLLISKAYFTFLFRLLCLHETNESESS